MDQTNSEAPTKKRKLGDVAIDNTTEEEEEDQIQKKDRKEDGNDNSQGDDDSSKPQEEKEDKEIKDKDEEDGDDGDNNNKKEIPKEEKDEEVTKDNGNSEDKDEDKQEESNTNDAMDIDTTKEDDSNKERQVEGGDNDKQTETTEEAAAAAEDEKNKPAAAAAVPTTTTTTNNNNQSNNKKKEEDDNKNPYETLKWIVVKNDGKPESLIKLVALKSLFSKQLPKMPRAYIARLVFDRRHTAIAILNDDPAVKDTDEEVIGSICYRAFPEMRFAEIAFCAVNASHQVKGYGTKLMNLLKQEGARTGIEYFITYADNYAIGYFKKQGFTKTISMPKGRYQGLIKDYDGGTMMECYVHPSIDFTRIQQMIAAQRAFLLDRIRLKANSHRVYEPLPNNFSPNLEGVSRANEAAARAMAIPGMLDAGWTMTDLLAATGQGKDVDRAKNALKSELLSMVRKVEEQQFAWPFREPVDTSEVQDYLEVIKEPIDLSTIDKRIRKGDHYKSKQMLYADLILMVNNCKLYNEPTSTYVQCANSLETYLGTLFRDSRV